ncbi:MAG TPA: DMT family transporter, partial [Kineosporiaceae bacterium]
TGLAVVAAVLFALTTNLQRVAASSVSVGGGPLHLVRRLATDRRWLGGGLIGGAALALHAMALGRGSVLVVQSVMAVGLVIALALEAVREGRRLHPHELGGALLVVIGVSAVVAVGRVPDLAAERGWSAVVPCLLVTSGTGAAVVASRHRVGSRWGARALAAAGGACFAVDAAFLQRVTALVEAGGSSASGRALVAVAGDLAGFLSGSIVGTVAVHRAYQVAPLRVVQPALAAAEPMTAFAVGVTVLHQEVWGGAAGYLVLIGGLLVLVAGIFLGLRPAAARRAVPSAPVTSLCPARPPADRASGPQPGPGASRRTASLGPALQRQRSGSLVKA